MTRRGKISSLFLLLAPLAFLATGNPCGAGSTTTASSSPKSTTNGAAISAPQYTGPGSCSSSSCHGSVSPRTENRVWQNEYSIWVVKDKHAQAYSVLSGPVATRMATILGLGQAKTAHKCLACHALDVPPAQRARTFDLGDGVSCESCHGPAAAWLGPHTTNGWTHEQSVALGMVDLRDLTVRSDKCLSCHLGNQEQFVDHEMIAAGHPDLTFELDSFSAVMPRHWKEPPTGTADPWYGVRELTVGQAVQLREAMDRLSGRAHGAHWPEYSELDCFACHHNWTPSEKSWRQARGYPGRRPGDPPWNDSRYVIFHYLIEQADAGTAKQLDADMAQVTQLMSQLNPNRDSVVAAANSASHAAGELTHKLATVPYDQAATLQLLRQISGDADKIGAQGERSAEQAAMAVQSLFVAYSSNANPPNAAEVRVAISDLFKEFQDPSAYDPARFSRQMHKVNSLLP